MVIDEEFPGFLPDRTRRLHNSQEENRFAGCGALGQSVLHVGHFVQTLRPS